MGIRDFFRKKEDTIIDLRDLKKREQVRQRGAVTSVKKNSDVVDLTGSSEDSGSVFGFLGALAGSSSSKDATDIDNETQRSITPDAKTKLKGILRDMKLEIKNNNDKIFKLLDRVDLLEKKLERLERRSNYGQ